MLKKVNIYKLHVKKAKRVFTRGREGHRSSSAAIQALTAAALRQFPYPSHYPPCLYISTRKISFQYHIFNSLYISHSENILFSILHFLDKLLTVHPT